MTAEEIAIKQHLSKPRPEPLPCGCVGPRGGDPLCPCAMAWCENVNGVWYKITEERNSAGIELKANRIDRV